MTPGDVDAVAALEAAAFTRGWSPAAFHRELTTNGAARYLVLEDARARILAFGGLWLMLDEAHIVTVAVDESLRKMGYGRTVVDGLVRLAQGLGMANATLECRVSNEAARALYRDYGFYEVGARKAYYADNSEDAVIMTTEPFANDSYQERLLRLQAKLPAFTNAVEALS
jgi:ribosomal-protein-alanine N-acetyltransferase